MKHQSINWDKLDSYLQFKASLNTCASLLEVSPKTIERRIRENHDCTFAEYRERLMAPVGIKLANKAVGMAMDGDRTMLIFCLKNLAGWADKSEIEQTNRNIIINIDKGDENL